ncbi:MAG: hypothetical protein BRC29_03775 [Nanohaloarchaea archaeon SW_7_43_1]|nr:MAG: hypothetical protein BRC29_03775 [Nanohaloarchaea archaeon SW_7_43_1]
MLHNQIRDEGNGLYLIKQLSEDHTDFSFADIEQSLLQQDYEHKDEGNGNQTSEIKLANSDTETVIKYKYGTDEAKFYFTDLSPTKEKVLDEALTVGHIDGAFSLKNLYSMENDNSKDEIAFGTEEYWKKVDEIYGN